MAEENNYFETKKSLTAASECKMLTEKLGAYQETNQDFTYRATSYEYVVEKRYNGSYVSQDNRYTNLRFNFKKFLSESNLSFTETYTTGTMRPLNRPQMVIKKEFKAFMENRGLNYIDPGLVYFSAPQAPLVDTIRTRNWMAVSKLYHDTKARALEVPNITVRTIIQMTEVLAIGPIYKHGWWYPSIYQPDIIKYIFEHNIMRQLHSSIRGPTPSQRILLEQALVYDIAQNYKTSSSRVLLMWAIKRGFAVVPTSLYNRHIQEVNRIFVNIGEHEMFALDSLREVNKMYCWDPIEID